MICPLPLYHRLCYSLMCWLFVWFCVFFRSVSCLVFSHATKHRSCFGGRTATKVWNGCTPKVAHSYEHEPLPEHEPIAIMTTIHRLQASFRPLSSLTINHRAEAKITTQQPRGQGGRTTQRIGQESACVHTKSLFYPSGHYPGLSSPRDLGDARRPKQGNRWGVGER